MKLLDVRRLEFVAVPLLSLVLLFTSLFRLDLPGLYYDEALFIPPAAKLFDDCSLNAGIFFKIGCVPIILQPPYIGSLKALLYAPIFGIFGVGVFSIRLPGVLILLVSNLAFWWFWRRRVGEWLGLLLFAFLCVDAGSVFHARVDWGPYVLQNAGKLALLCILTAWLETRASRYFALACLIVFVGMFDKLNFLWLVPAFSLAIGLAYRRLAIDAFAAHLKPNAAIVLVSAAIGTLWLVKLVIPIAIAGTNPLPFVLSEQFVRILGLVTGTLNAGAYPVLFGSAWPGSTWLSTIVYASTFAGLALLPFLGVLARRFEPMSVVARLARYSALLAVIESALFACLVATKEAGGPHHAIIFSHIWQLQLIATVGFVLAIARDLGRPLRTAIFAACIGLCGTVVVLNLASVRHHLDALNPRHPFSAAFSPATYDLVRVLEGLDASEIASVDWGIHNVVFSLAKPGTRGRYADRWPTFNDLGQGRISSADAMSVIQSGDSIAFVARPPELAIFPNTIKGLGMLIGRASECAVQPKMIHDALGRLQYLVYQIPRRCIG